MLVFLALRNSSDHIQEVWFPWIPCIRMRIGKMHDLRFALRRRIAVLGWVVHMKSGILKSSTLILWRLLYGFQMFESHIRPRTVLPGHSYGKVVLVAQITMTNCDNVRCICMLLWVLLNKEIMTMMHQYILTWFAWTKTSLSKWNYNHYDQLQSGLQPSHD